MTCATNAEAMTLEWPMWWAINLFVVTVPPFYLGLIGQPALAYIVYALGAGATVTLAEQPSFVRSLPTRPDVRGFLTVRIMLVLLCGLLPYLIGSDIEVSSW